jgi:hypothetical protein
MNVKEKIAELNLPQNSYIVVGSGVMGALGIRESNDIDMVVTKEAYNYVKSLGWETGAWGDTTVFQKDVFDIGDDWYGKTAEDLLEHAQVIDDVPYLSLDDVYEWKKQKGRDKDIHDLELIDAYREIKSSTI